MADILLTTINARYAHASLGLRCLLANLGALSGRARIVEFALGQRTEDMVERLLADRPRVIGLGVYIWNADAALQLARALKALAPEVRLVIGGPEVSHELDDQPIVALADHVITGAADLAFAQLCDSLLAEGPRALPPRVIEGGAPDPATLALPYRHFSAEDIAHRTLYVEASRGCPFKCEYCLSALDRTAVPFDTDRLLAELGGLLARGARRFKFVDRTFNLKVQTSLAILEFFLERMTRAPDDPLHLHFELVPDHLPAALKASIARFPEGSLQFEIGIQTWAPQVQALISRRQDNARAEDNLRWLRTETQAHLHVDLIAGLPGEDLASFGRGFDRLVALRPHEIQVGILKRLRGAPIARHTAAFDLRFNPSPPYNLLSSDRWPFSDMQRIGRFARYWDLVGNSGRFGNSLPLMLGEAPFDRFLAFSDWVWANTDATHRLALDRQFALVQAWLAGPGEVGEAQAGDAVRSDRAASGTGTSPRTAGATPPRQRRHISGVTS